MSAEIRPADYFVAGGTLKPDTPSYVTRPADDELFDLVLSGEFCYVLTPRQMGKSSLMVRTAQRLRECQVRTAIIDLTQIGTEISDERWYLSLLSQLKRRLQLSVDPVAWWQARTDLASVLRFTDFLRDVVLVEVPDRIVIFIDEIDTTLSLDFRDDFFAAIRAVYNERAAAPEFERLTFVLLGVASPPELIKDQARTPFNIGHAIALQEFSWADSAVLREGLDAVLPGQGNAIFGKIYHWTSGHPYLTQKICLTMAESGDENASAERVDGLVEELFLSEEARRETNLQFVRNKILANPQSGELLALYKDIVRGRKVQDDGQSVVQNQLRLSGLVKVENGILQTRNEIYRRAFNHEWVSRHTAINWAPIVAGAAVLVALLAVGLLSFNLWVINQCNSYGHDVLLPTSSAETRLTKLAQAFRLPKPLFGSSTCAHEAPEWFYGLSGEEQIALFQASKEETEDLTVVIRNIYVTLADVENTDGTGPLLEAMADALSGLDGVGEAKSLRDEISSWRRGRDLFRQNHEDPLQAYMDSIEEYTKAVALRSDNPAVRYERARVYIRLAQSRESSQSSSYYDFALSDLDRVMAWALQALEATDTPTPAPTTPISATLDTTLTPVPMTTRTPTSTADPPLLPASVYTATHEITAAALPTATLPTASIISRFRNYYEMRSAVRGLLYSEEGQGALAVLMSSPQKYTYLEEAGLTPTPVETIMSDAFLVEHLDSGSMVDIAGIVADVGYNAANYQGYAVWEKPLSGFRGAGGALPALGVTIRYAISSEGDLYVGSVGAPAEALAVLIGHNEWWAKELSLRDIVLYRLLRVEYNRLEGDGYVSEGNGLDGPVDIWNNYGETIQIMYSAVIMFADYNSEWVVADRLDVWDPSGSGETSYTGDTWRRLDLSCSGNTQVFVYSHAANDNANNTYVKHDGVTVASRGTSIGFDDHTRLDSCPTSVEMGGNRTWSELDASLTVVVVGGSISSSGHAEFPANGGNPAPSVLTIPPR